MIKLQQLQSPVYKEMVGSEFSYDTAQDAHVHQQKELLHRGIQISPLVWHHKDVRTKIIEKRTETG